MNREQIRNFFYDKCTTAQAREVELWLADNSTDEKLQQYLGELMDDVYKTDISKMPDRSRQRFERFCKNIDLERNASPRHNARRISLWSAAAAVCFALLCTSFYFMRQSELPKQWNEIYVPYGQTREITLPDGSNIILNAGSKLIFPQKFNREVRQIYLSGQAFVDVVKDAKRPFILSAGEATVKVLGTKFNVTSYMEDSQIDVALAEGSVELKLDMYGSVPMVRLMKPGDVVLIDKTNGKVEQYTFDADKYLAKNGSIALNWVNKSLSDIIKHLERCFDAEFIVTNDELLKERYFASFVNNEPLGEILDAICSQGIDIRQEGTIYYLSPKLRD